MQSEFLEKAVALSKAIRSEGRRRPFENGVREFIQHLATVPDYPVADFSDDGVMTLQTLADGVIEAIEQRVSTQKDPSADQQQLVSGIYELRRVLELIDQSRRRA